MVSILPSQRTGLDVLGQYLGQGASAAMPQMYENMKVQRGVKALEQAQKGIEAAQGDPYKIALEFAKAGAQAPGLERALAPLMQTAMSQSIAERAFPRGAEAGVSPMQAAAPAIPGAQQQMAQPQAPGLQQAAPPEAVPELPKPEFAAPTPFNVMTAPEIDAESQRYAIATRDPNNYAVRQAQLQKQNAIADEQRGSLEDMALAQGIGANELPRFMQVGSKFDPRNPSEWMQKARREYSKIKNFDKSLERAFIPGLGSALLGRNRQEALKKLEPSVKGLVDAGLEQETRNKLAEEFLSPTEVSTLLHPLTKQQEEQIKSFPRGLFHTETLGEATLGKLGGARSPLISYEEALEKAPRELEQMQNKLSEFFIKNVSPNTSLLGLREKLVMDRDYDWRQIGPALRDAEGKGLKLTPEQATEMTDIETQPPIQSLPDLFQDLERPIQYLRGYR